MKNMLQNISKHRHKYLKWFWIAMVPVTLIWLKESILWVSIMSLYANIEASASAEEAKKGKRDVK